jgi:D-3-phosphoglycerate dehydrogenase / 2-oxoglutarate reductase
MHKSKGIHVVHSPEGNCDAVGEHALALSLCLLKHIVSSSMQVKNGIWNREENRGGELMGRTVGIIGYGNTGSAFARKLSGMGVKILAFDKYKTGFGTDTVEETDLPTLLKKAQIISFHVPLTNETHHYADEVFLNKCCKGVVLLNTSRGSVVNTEHLVEAMKVGKVAAAGLDVVEWETFDFNIASESENKNIQFLLDSPSVIITPHIAGITHEATLKHAQILVEKIKNCFA